MALPRVPASPVPFTVAEYFPTPGVTPFHDPRQHAVSLAFVVPVAGDCAPQQDALDLAWLTPEEALAPGVLAEMERGHGVLLRQALATSATRSDAPPRVCTPAWLRYRVARRSLPPARYRLAGDAFHPQRDPDCHQRDGQEQRLALVELVDGAGHVVRVLGRGLLGRRRRAAEPRRQVDEVVAGQGRVGRLLGGSCASMTAWSRAVASARFSSGPTWKGSPTMMEIGIPLRPRCLGRFLLHTRCEPQMVVGRIGTPASCAIRTAPGLNSLSSNERDIVASGKTPTISPSLTACTARMNEACRRAVDRDVLHPAHERTGDPVGEDRLLRHEADEAPGRLSREAGIREVEVARVVDRHDGAADAGTFSSPSIRNFDPLGGEHAAGRRDDRAVHGFHGRSLRLRRFAGPPPPSGSDSLAPRSAAGSPGQLCVAGCHASWTTWLPLSRVTSRPRPGGWSEP